jgi:hypothetical protein
MVNIWVRSWTPRCAFKHLDLGIHRAHKDARLWFQELLLGVSSSVPAASYRGEHCRYALHQGRDDNSQKP